MSDPEISDADTPSSPASTCQIIGLAAVRTGMCTFMRIAVRAFDEVTVATPTSVPACAPSWPVAPASSFVSVSKVGDQSGCSKTTWQ